MLAACTKDGKIYCVPWDIGPMGTFYRRDVFEAAGLASDPDSVSAMIATWDDLLTTCQTIKAETGLNCFALNKANNEGYLYEYMLSQQGLGYFNDAGYEPFQRRMDEHLRRAGYTFDQDWVTHKFDGAEHSERSWQERVHIPLEFLLGTG
jgi:ABC-type glycerol-3-phosphate transport system substrate-binding protein